MGRLAGLLLLWFRVNSEVVGGQGVFLSLLVSVAAEHEDASGDKH